MDTIIIFAIIFICLIFSSMALGGYYSYTTTQVAADKAAADKALADKAATDAKAASDAQAAADKAAADKAAADKATADKAAADAQVATDKATADKAAADKIASDKAAAQAVIDAQTAADAKAAAQVASDKAAAQAVIDAKIAADKAANLPTRNRTGVINAGSQRLSLNPLAADTTNNITADPFRLATSMSSNGVLFDANNNLIDVTNSDKCWSLGDGNIFKLTADKTKCASFTRTQYGEFKVGDMCMTANTNSTGNPITAKACITPDTTDPNTIKDYSTVYDFIPLSEWTNNAATPYDPNVASKYLVTQSTIDTKYPYRYGLNISAANTVIYTDHNGAPFMIKDDGTMVSLTNTNAEVCIAVDDTTSPTAPVLKVLGLAGILPGTTTEISTADGTTNAATCKKYKTAIDSNNFITMTKQDTTAKKYCISPENTEVVYNIQLNDGTKTNRYVPTSGTNAVLSACPTDYDSVKAPYPNKRVGTLGATRYTSTASPLKYNESSTKPMCIHPWGGASSPADHTRLGTDSCANLPRIRYDYDSTTGFIRHMTSGKCVVPAGGLDNIYEGTSVVLLNKCDPVMAKFNKQDNGNFVHDASKLCLKANGTTMGSMISLTRDCTGTKHKFTI